MRRHALRSVIVATAAFVISLGSVASAGAARRLHGAAARELALHRVLRIQARREATAAHTASTFRTTPSDPDFGPQGDEYGDERTAPGGTLSGAALISAQAQASALPAVGGSWQEVTTQPFQAEAAGYDDPFWSNEGAGFSLVGGRTTSLAATRDGAWFAGTADGGVWRSFNQGGQWTPVFDSMPSLSIGALAVDPADGSLWVGTGEGNTSSDEYAGTGVYRTSNDGASFALVGGSSDPLAGRNIYNLAFDPHGNAYAASSNGLFRYSATTGQWSEVLDPAGVTPPTPYDNQVTNVQVVPGTGGQDVIAAIGWRGNFAPAPESEGLENNGFYASTNGGESFTEVTPSGQIDASDIGRTTFAYSADGTKLYAIVEGPQEFYAGDESVLQGIFVSTGSPASVTGPWEKIGDEATLAASGSALPIGSGYGVGVQADYNQDLAVDPSNDQHVYAGLEEVFQSTNGGQTWNTASPYWNYTLPCEASFSQDSCPNTTHPDQHALMITGGTLVIGNDGGIYSRALSDTQQYGGWTDLNATLRSWQYYDARAGVLPGASGGLGVWGGLQDNGTSVLESGSPQMVEPAGGDGTDVIVDHSNANQMVGEYADGVMYSTQDGGHTFADPISPGCVAQQTIGLTPTSTCDPSMRFVTPLVPDNFNDNVWITGGRYVWESRAGWSTSCTSDTACSWQRLYDTGANNAVTAIASTFNGRVLYVGFVGGAGNPGPLFSRGLATNFGGAWHTITTPNLPNRFIAGVTVDPFDPAHVYAIFNGYSRRWIPGGGVGHVYESWNAGRSWQDISGDLPDIAADALVDNRGVLALATDSGAYVARVGQGGLTRWARLGVGLPNSSINDLTPGPNGYVYAATHGRGIWRLQLGVSPWRRW